MFIFKSPNSQQVLGNAVFVNYLLTSWLRYGQLKVLFLCSEQTQRVETLHRASARSRGQYWRHLPHEWKLKFFQKICQYVPVMEKICQKGLKVAKYSAKVALVTRELMAEGGWGCSPQWTYGKHWRLSVGVSTVIEHTERAIQNV